MAAAQPTAQLDNCRILKALRLSGSHNILLVSL